MPCIAQAAEGGQRKAVRLKTSKSYRSRRRKRSSLKPFRNTTHCSKAERWQRLIGQPVEAHHEFITPKLLIETLCAHDIKPDVSRLSTLSGSSWQADSGSSTSSNFSDQTPFDKKLDLFPLPQFKTAPPPKKGHRRVRSAEHKRTQWATKRAFDVLSARDNLIPSAAEKTAEVTTIPQSLEFESDDDTCDRSESISNYQDDLFGAHQFPHRRISSSFSESSCRTSAFIHETTDWEWEQVYTANKYLCVSDTEEGSDYEDSTSSSEKEFVASFTSLPFVPNQASETISLKNMEENIDKSIKMLKSLTPSNSLTDVFSAEEEQRRSVEKTRSRSGAGERVVSRRKLRRDTSDPGKRVSPRGMVDSPPDLDVTLSGTYHSINGKSSNYINESQGLCLLISDISRPDRRSPRRVRAVDIARVLHADKRELVGAFSVELLQQRTRDSKSASSPRSQTLCALLYTVDQFRDVVQGIYGDSERGLSFAVDKLSSGRALGSYVPEAWLQFRSRRDVFETTEHFVHHYYQTTVTETAI